MTIYFRPLILTAGRNKSAYFSRRDDSKLTSNKTLAQLYIDRDAAERAIKRYKQRYPMDEIVYSEIEEIDGSRESNPSRRSAHTAKFDRCVESVNRSGSPVNPYAVCSSAIGYRGSVKKGHRRRKNPSKRKKSSHEGPAPYPSRPEFIESFPYGYEIRFLRGSGFYHIFRDGLPIHQASKNLDQVRKWVEYAVQREEVLNAPPGERNDLERKFGHRKENPLPSVRKVYYIICAHKGTENYYLARSGKLTRSQAGAQRFATAAAAIDKAKAHLRAYAASRKYRFDLKLAY